MVINPKDIVQNKPARRLRTPKTQTRLPSPRTQHKINPNVQINSPPNPRASSPPNPNQSNAKIKAPSSTCWSGGRIALIPLVNYLAAAANPFFYNAGLRLGSVLAYRAILLIFYRRILFDPQVPRATARNFPTWPTIWVLVNYLEYAFFAHSTRFLDISISTILFETWPVFLIFLRSYLFRKKLGYHRLGPEILLVLSLSFTGLLFVVGNQTNNPGQPGIHLTAGTHAIVLGTLLALTASACSSMFAFAYRWIENLEHLLPKQLVKTHQGPPIAIFSNTTATMMGSAVETIALLPIKMESSIVFQHQTGPCRLIVRTSGENSDPQEVAPAELTGACSACKLRTAPLK